MNELGYCINTETAAPGLKAEDLVNNHDATLIDTPTELPNNGKVLVCVVVNHGFDAAALVYNVRELQDFTEPSDYRAKQWLLMDKTKAYELAGKEDFLTEQTALTTFETGHGEVELSPGVIKRLFAPLATEEECYVFLRTCQAQGLNPFLGEAYLIKYDVKKPASIVVGKNTFTQRAESHPQYGGMTYGVIVERDKVVLDLSSSFTLPTDTLLGGWAKVNRADREIPIEKRVSLREYDTGQSIWKNKPGTMIEKVAIVQAIREAFPKTTSGLRDSAEMGVDLPAVPDAAAVEAVEPTRAETPPETGAQGQMPDFADQARAMEQPR